jgi:hypothetical protein
MSKIRALVVLAATVVALALWVIVDPVGGHPIDVRPSSSATPQHVGAGSVVAASLVAGLAAWALLAALERWLRRGRMIWTVIATVVLLLSLLAGPPAGIGAATKITLAALHLIVGATLILGLRKRPEHA